MIDHLSDETPGSDYIRGRGALSNNGSRVQPLKSVYADGADRPAATTRCRPVQVRSIIARNTSPDLPFEQSVNPFQGCKHGSIYCYARPSHAYHDLSPGLDFETLINYTQSAAEQLRRELRRPAYRSP